MSQNINEKQPKNQDKNTSIDEHTLPLEEVCRRYETSVTPLKPEGCKGLSSQKASGLLEIHGRNILSPPKKVHPVTMFLKCLTELFNLLLIIAGILTYILYAIDPADNSTNTYLGAILLVVAFLNALIEFVQMKKSASILESFMNMIPQQCKCIREQKLMSIPAAELVPGDVVYVKLGDKIPADLLLFNATDLKVDNSSLTGESEPQERTPENEEKNCLEATNLAFNGTLAVSGEGYGIVIRTGDNTVLGQIAGLTSGEGKSESPLTTEINNFVKIIATIAFITALIFFIISIVQYNINIALNFAIGTFVAWVPEGLPATITMLLTIAAKRMATENVLVKDLKGVETLGAITILATDKTGTLTKNQMTVTNIWSSLNLYASLRNLGSPGNPVSIESDGIKEIMMNSCLNSKTKFDTTDKPINEREIIGDATETGLTRFAIQNMKAFDEIQQEYTKVFEIPFNSENKWAMSINKDPKTQKLTLYLKGAPERVLRLCSDILINNETVSLSEEHKTRFNEAYESMASKGHRVLAFAQLPLPEDKYNSEYVFDRKAKNYPDSGLTFVGLVSLEDPPKHGVREAIGICRKAGIRVMMVTGDHPLTAEAIGRKINLITSDTKQDAAKKLKKAEAEVKENEYDAVVIHGEKIDALNDEEWDKIFSKNEIIFARTSPKHKLEIVKRAQSMGHIVGVTGDGVNDSPALKRADLGIAMNQTGSDVSKEAASMILLDDNFASTVKGIEQGRLIFSNLKKSIQYTVTHSIPEVVPQLLYIICAIPLPISSILILVIDLGFEMFASLSYAWDQPETKDGLMRLCPRKPVTEQSVERYRRLNSQKLQPTVDKESGKKLEPTKAQRIKHRFTKLFSLQVWKQKFEKTDDEVMVDKGLLSWAYLEVGMIEAAVSLLAYFLVLYKNNITPYTAVQMQKANMFASNKDDYLANDRVFTYSERSEALAQAQSIYYLTVMITQGFNLFACKSKLRLPFGRHIFTNWRNFVFLIAGFALGILIIYTPGLNTVFGASNNTSPLYWLIGIAGGILILLYTVLRFYIIKLSSKNRFNPEISGLQMHPTVRTQNSRNPVDADKTLS